MNRALRVRQSRGSFLRPSGFFGILDSICGSFGISVFVSGFEPFNNIRRC